MITAAVKPYTLIFSRPAGTSRGVYQTRRSWYIVLRSEDRIGIGECAPLPNLSCDDIPNYQERIEHLCGLINAGVGVDFEELRLYPSILFGFETALRDMVADNHILWKTPFSGGEAGMPINGLIWMGKHDYMLDQIDAKVQQGFKCLKLKVGAIDFEQELSLVQHIRERYASSELEIRLDANGGFSPDEVLSRLDRFSKYHIHSIEQPIMARQIAEMASLIKRTPIRVALDEELIGVNTFSQKRELLEEIRPHFIILKPSLHGGILGSSEWIELAGQFNVGWWITSALESNVGLNAIAQWCASLQVSVPQGLGTGMLFDNNVGSPLEIRGQELWYNGSGSWNFDGIL